MSILKLLFGAPAAAIAPAPQPLAHHLYVSPARAEAQRDALDAALDEMETLQTMGHSKRYAFACALEKLATEYASPNARTAGRKLRAWANSLLAREIDRERERP